MQTIYIDISNKMVLPKIYAKQGDVGRKFEVVFTDSGVPYNIPLNALFSVWFSGASGEGNYTHIGDVSAFTITNNHVAVEIIAEMLKNKGEGVLCLVLNNENKQIGTWNIPYICEEVPGFESEAVKEYYTAFSALVGQLKTPDTTFSKAGYPADAKATGDITVNNKQLRDNPRLTASDVGAAPAGLSLYDVIVASENDLDTALTTAYSKVNDKGVGFVRIHVQPGNLPLCSGSWFFTIFRTEPSYGTVFGSCYFNDDFVFRNLLDGEWGEWEFSNPPMYLGVEYRTTERHNGKAVYAKLVNCGKATNGAKVTIDGMTSCVRYVGLISPPNEAYPLRTLPMRSGGLSGTGYYAEVSQGFNIYNVGKFGIATDSNSDGMGTGSYTWFVQVWYTKN